MDLQQLQQRIQPWLSDASQIKLAKSASLILIVIILYQLAGMIWLFVPEPQLPATAAKPPAKVSASQTSKLDIRSLVTLSLFGKVSDKPQVVEQRVTEAPVTKLNLKLTGVVASTDPKAGGAIIAHGGKEETYGIGEKISGTRAVLKEIHNDRVIIEQSGRAETVMLEDEEYSKVVPERNAAKGPTQLQARTKSPLNKRDVSRQVASLRRDAKSNPAKLMDYISISPQQKDNKLVGYRLRPGKDAAFFKSVGLRTGDVAVSINGLDLTDARQAREALNALRNEQNVSMIVLRGEEEISLELSTEQE